MSLQGKTTISDDFELGGEGEMEPMSSMTFSTQMCMQIIFDIKYH